jgi:hypothetical protein
VIIDDQVMVPAEAIPLRLPHPPVGDAGVDEDEPVRAAGDTGDVEGDSVEVSGTRSSFRADLPSSPNLRSRTCA